ncbi:HalOD1 output domain-containing protein [Haladaptatus pallidirubidus]|uniref:Halobacterial output domain-containing protein n=1 Tax=Haladaptatus pallidirubidus TaxID=1008152 RepID=A0AAV3UH55_9EURY|nr:HalOD1 output domain-containing protein [Haladaptatus pallidirubidus]
MTSSNDHTDDGTELAQDGNGSNDPDMTFVTQAHYDRESHRDLTTEIIFAIADAEDITPTEIKDPPLYECVDIAAIEDGFFGPKVNGRTRDSARSVAFQYNQYRVAVASDGWITVSEPAEYEEISGSE